MPSRLSLVAALLLVPAFLAGCETVPPPARPQAVHNASRIELGVSRIDLAAGRPLVLVLPHPADAPPPKIPPIAFAGGPPLPTQLVRLTASVEPGASPQDRWIGPPSRWSTAAETAGSRAAWAVVVDVPPSARALALVVGEESIPVQWLDPDADPPAPPLPEPIPDPVLRWFGDSAQDPARRWRLELLARRIDEPAGPLHAALAEPFDDPHAEALAAQASLRWRAGLARLAQADQAIADEVCHALTRVAVVAGETVPVWVADGASLGAIHDTLLDPSLGPAARAAAARIWLAAQPRTVSRVADDAAAVRPPDAAFARIEATNLTADRIGCIARTVSGTRLDEGAGVEIPMAPATTGDALLPVPLLDQSAFRAPLAAAPSSIRVQAAGQTRSLTLVPAPGAARPPGVLASPFYRELTLSAWAHDSAPPEAPDWTTAALLQRHPVTEAWQVYVECRAGHGAPAETDVVRLHFGLAAAPDAVVEVRPGTPARLKTAAGERTFAVAGEAAEGRWTAIVPVPEEALRGAERLGEGRPLLLFAAERESPAGRATWPRPALPWQSRPGRALIDLAQWPPSNAP